MIDYKELVINFILDCYDRGYFDSDMLEKYVVLWYKIEDSPNYLRKCYHIWDRIWNTDLPLEHIIQMESTNGWSKA